MRKQGIYMAIIKKIYLILICLTLFACSDKSANEYLTSAKDKIAEKNYNAASIELKNVIKQAPKLAEARFLLGKVYLQLHQYENAEKEFNRALKFDYPANEVVPLLSQSYQKTGADNALIKLSHKQKGLTTAQATQVAFYKLQAFVKLKQNLKAKSIIKEIKNFKTTSPFKSLALVYALLIDTNLEKEQDNNLEKEQDKNIATALLQLDNILKKHPKQADALKLKANILLNQAQGDKNKIEQVIAIYRDYVKYYPEDTQATFIFARLLTDANLTTEAEPLVDKLLKINSENMLLNQLKGLARFNAKDSKNALLYTEKAIRLNPNDIALRLVAGISAYLDKNYQVANQHLSFIADQLPPSHEALRLLAASQLQLGLTLDANKTLAKFDHVSSKDSTLFSNVGLALVKSGEVVKAKEILRKSPQVDNKLKNNSEQLAQLGLLKLSLNDLSGIINIEDALVIGKSEKNINKAPQVPLEQTLATVYLYTNQLDKALVLAERWKEEQPKNIQAYFVAGLAYLKSQKLGDARAEFEQLLTIEPNNVKAKMALLNLKAKENNQQQNKTALNEILKIQPDYAPALIQLYALAKQSGNTKGVVERIKKRIKATPENASLQITLAKIYFSEQRFDDSSALLEALKMRSEKPAPFWELLGQSYVQQKVYDKARSLYQEWLVKQPNNRSAMLGNLVVMDSEGKFKQALQLIKNYLAKRGEDAQIQLLQSYLLVMNNEFEQAQQSYDKLPTTLLALPFSKGVLGQLQLHNNNVASALVNLQSAYQATPNSRNARLVMLAFYKLKQKEKGQQFLISHVKKHPQDQLSLMQLANEQLQQNTEKALTSYQKAVKLNPNNGVAQNNLAFLYMQQNKLDLALKHAQQALNVMPKDENVLDTLGQIYLLKQDAEMALEYLSKAVSQDNVKGKKVADEIYVNYIKALLLNGQTTLAERKMAQRKITNRKSQLILASLKEKFNLKS